MLVLRRVHKRKGNSGGWTCGSRWRCVRSMTEGVVLREREREKAWSVE